MNIFGKRTLYPRLKVSISCIHQFEVSKNKMKLASFQNRSAQQPPQDKIILSKKYKYLKKAYVIIMPEPLSAKVSKGHVKLKFTSTFI